MKKNVSKFDYCYGCGVCSSVCNKDAITIGLDKDGFYAPTVNDRKCADCGLCLSVCAFEHAEIACKPEHMKSWAAWSNDEKVHRKCSSGGIGFEIGKQLIESGYHAIGCRYDIRKQRAEHFVAKTVKEFVQSIGSKYIQSYTEEAFKQIKRKGQKYLISGTPCQIDSVRRIIKKFHCEDNFVLMDFFCHGVPSMWAWKAYIKMLEPKIGKVTYASWRNKFEYGWHDNWLMGMDGEKTAQPVNWEDQYDVLISERDCYYKSRRTQGDLFYKLFLGDVCCGKHCDKNCKYKYDQSSADIRIGDLWGETYKDDEKGTSALITFTQKGENIINQMKNVILVSHPFEVVAEGQMRKNVRRRELASLVVYLLRNEYKINGICMKTVLFLQRMITRLNRMMK